MSHSAPQGSDALEFIELSEDDLIQIQGGGWFKKLTGISTPKFLKDLDDRVNQKPGGWFGVIAKAVATYYSGGSAKSIIGDIFAV